MQLVDRELFTNRHLEWDLSTVSAAQRGKKYLYARTENISFVGVAGEKCCNFEQFFYIFVYLFHWLRSCTNYSCNIRNTEGLSKTYVDRNQKAPTQCAFHSNLIICNYKSTLRVWVGAGIASVSRRAEEISHNLRMFCSYPCLRSY
jgi:hypothetical protein